MLTASLLMSTACERAFSTTVASKPMRVRTPPVKKVTTPQEAAPLRQPYTGDFLHNSGKKQTEID